MSLPYRLGSSSVFIRPHEHTKEPKRVVFLSTEGTTTEVDYFKYIERFREQLGIDAVVHIQVLRKHDTNSDPDSVLELLDEYVRFREDKMYEKEIDALSLKSYQTDFIMSYLDDPSQLPSHERNKFEAILIEEHIDLLYLDFLNKYRGKDDRFGIVIDRDCRSHSIDQLNRVIEKCNQKKYLYYITNPCLEFWLLLHISDVQTEYTDQLDQILNNPVDEHGNTFVSNLLYSKTGQRKSIQVKVFEKYYLQNIDLAIRRAQDFASNEKLLTGIGSNLGDLFALLRSK